MNWSAQSRAMELYTRIFLYIWNKTNCLLFFGSLKCRSVHSRLMVIRKIQITQNHFKATIKSNNLKDLYLDSVFHWEKFSIFIDFFVDLKIFVLTPNYITFSCRFELLCCNTKWKLVVKTSSCNSHYLCYPDLEACNCIGLTRIWVVMGTKVSEPT